MKPEFYFMLGFPLSPLYSGIMSFRAFLYKKGILQSTRLPVPVISVGNLTMGGTGKTPMVISVARFLQRCGHVPVVLSRGYGGKSRGQVNVVSDRTEIYLSAEDAGDEPRFLAESLPGVPVVTGVKRSVTGKFACGRFNPDVIVLDDGFQHLALQRDIDLVLFSSGTLVGNGRVFPGGTLRESFKALGRASAFIMTGGMEHGIQQSAFLEKIRGKFPEIPFFNTDYRPVSMVGNAMSSPSLQDAKGKKWFGFCGLADPDGFRKTLEREGFRLSGFRSYSDHYPYGKEDAEQLAGLARSMGLDGLITTEKDYVKFVKLNVKIQTTALRMETVLSQSLQDFLAGELSKLQSKPESNLGSP